MKIIKTFSLLSLMLLLMGACENNRNNAEEVIVEEDVDPNVVTDRWGEAWTSNQFDSVMNMTADDAIVLLNGQQIPQDSLSDWLQWTSTNMKNLEMNSLAKSSQGNTTWDSGTFSHTYENDSMTYEGTYTFIWERTDAGQDDWKVKVMNINGNRGNDTLVSQEEGGI